ncbi:IS481 family transposase [Streptococcus pyogenes]|jgi:transposase InsO family protein|uniref:IS481 family transposase n=1 Tax=Streptococcus pyogenes TaxID=1314 RepID=UPI003DA05AC3
MAWQERDTVSIRLEFVRLAAQPGANRRELCRRFEVSPKTAYKWLERFDGSRESLQDRSRRPRSSPERSCAVVEEAVVQLRQQHPEWGGRKISRRLLDLGCAQVAPSTVTSILHRHGLICAHASEQAAPTQRFEHPEPNALWQMDFAGYFNTLAGACYPLAVLDDHSRFNLALTANARFAAADIQPQLHAVFQRYGLPVRINVDNGPPWGGAWAVKDGLTELTVWLIRLGVVVSHSRPHHPQTNGKVERFHRSLNTEVIGQRLFADHQQVQRAFDRWRHVYNFQRPHDALQMQTPIQRYRPSPKRMPKSLPPIEYASNDIVLKVAHERIRFKGRTWPISRALTGLPIAVRPDPDVEGRYQLYFCKHRFGSIDLNRPPVDS